MRFQKGIGSPYPRRPRGPGRGDPPYDMSREAYQARISSASKARAALAEQHDRRERTYEETRRLEQEIALASLRGETYRAMARRLGCSHVHCWRVARRYRTGQIPMLPHDEQGLVALRESLDKPPTPTRQVTAPWWMTREWGCRNEIWGCSLLTQEQKVQAAAEFDRREYARQHGLPLPEPQRVQPLRQPVTPREPQTPVALYPRSADEWRAEARRQRERPERQERYSASGRRVLFSVPVR